MIRHVLAISVSLTGLATSGSAMETPDGLPKPHYHQAASDPAWLSYAVQFHGHLGPWAVAGLRSGMAARRAVEADGYFDLDVIVTGPMVKPPHSCFLDGLQVSTGATLGKRNLRWIKAEKIDQIVVRVKNTRSGKQVEVCPTPTLLKLLTSFKGRPIAGSPAPDDEGHHHHDHEGLLLEALARKIAVAPREQILKVTPVE